MHACMHDRILCILSACGATATSLHRATAAQHPGVDLREMPAGAPRACTRCGRFVNGRPVHGGPAAKLLRALFQAALQAWQRAHAAPAPGAQRAAPAQAARPHPAFLLFIACPPGLYDAAFDPGKTMVEFADWGPVLAAVRAAACRVWHTCLPPALAPVGGLDDGAAAPAARPGAVRSAPEARARQGGAARPAAEARRSSFVDWLSGEPQGAAGAMWPAGAVAGRGSGPTARRGGGSGSAGAGAGSAPCLGAKRRRAAGEPGGAGPWRGVEQPRGPRKRARPEPLGAPKTSEEQLSPRPEKRAAGRGEAPASCRPPVLPQPWVGGAAHRRVLASARRQAAPAAVAAEPAAHERPRQAPDAAADREARAAERGRPAGESGAERRRAASAPPHARRTARGAHTNPVSSLRCSHGRLSPRAIAAGDPRPPGTAAPLGSARGLAVHDNAGGSGLSRAGGGREQGADAGGRAGGARRRDTVPGVCQWEGSGASSGLLQPYEPQPGHPAGGLGMRQRRAGRDSGAQRESVGPREQGRKAPAESAQASPGAGGGGREPDPGVSGSGFGPPQDPAPAEARVLDLEALAAGGAAVAPPALSRAQLARARPLPQARADACVGQDAPGLECWACWPNGRRCRVMSLSCWNASWRAGKPLGAPASRRWARRSHAARRPGTGAVLRGYHAGPAGRVKRAPAGRWHSSLCQRCRVACGRVRVEASGSRARRPAGGAEVCAGGVRGRAGSGGPARGRRARLPGAPARRGRPLPGPIAPCLALCAESCSGLRGVCSARRISAPHRMRRTAPEPAGRPCEEAGASAALHVRAQALGADNLPARPASERLARPARLDLGPRDLQARSPRPAAPLLQRTAWRCEQAVLGAGPASGIPMGQCTCWSQCAGLHALSSPCAGPQGSGVPACACALHAPGPPLYREQARSAPRRRPPCKAAVQTLPRRAGARRARAAAARMGLAVARGGGRGRRGAADARRLPAGRGPGRHRPAGAPPCSLRRLPPMQRGCVSQRACASFWPGRGMCSCRQMPAGGDALGGRIMTSEPRIG